MALCRRCRGVCNGGGTATLQTGARVCRVDVAMQSPPKGRSSGSGRNWRSGKRENFAHLPQMSAGRVGDIGAWNCADMDVSMRSVCQLQRAASACVRVRKFAEGCVQVPCQPLALLVCALTTTTTTTRSSAAAAMRLALLNTHNRMHDYTHVNSQQTNISISRGNALDVNTVFYYLQ